MMTISVVLLDLDGVIRHFDRALGERIEQAYGLAPGSLATAAFTGPDIELVVTGGISRAEWIRRIGDAVGAPAAARERFADIGRIDDRMMDLVDELRSWGIRVAVLTNGTDTIARELREHDVAHRFDAVFNSAEIGFAKPDSRAFRHVCDSLVVDPGSVFFTDDSPGHLTGAIAIGMTARLFESAAVCRAQICDLLAPCAR